MSRPLWFTTGGGHAEYTELEHDALMDSLLGQGVIPARSGTYANRLAVTSGSGTAIVAAGAAMVDKKLCTFESGVTLNVPTATAGTTGHRVVVRKDAAAKTSSLVLKSAADGTPTPPAESQTPGGLYEISLATLTRTTGGTITLTDVRLWASARGSVPLVRQGGNAVNWQAAGTTTYNVDGVLRQAGSVAFTTVSNGTICTVDVSANFPVAYLVGTTPLVFCALQMISNPANAVAGVTLDTVVNSAVTFRVRHTGTTAGSGVILWLAEGPLI